MDRKAATYNLLFGNNKWIIFSIAILVGVAMGIINPLSTTHMAANQAGGIWIGVISSSYFLFMAIGSIVIDKKLRGTDVKNLILVGLLLTASCSVLFPLLSSYLVWLLLMSFMGVGISFNMVGVQTALHNVSDEKSLAVVSGVYSLCFALGIIASALVGPKIYAHVTWLPFTIGGFCLVIAALLIQFKLTNVLVIPQHTEEKVFKKITVPLLGAFVYGFSETTVVSLYPLFLIRENVALSEIGYGLGIFVVGSIVGMIPLTFLADRIGRKKCLAICMLVSIFAVAGIIADSSMSSRLFFSFVAGFTIGPLYPLAMALSVQDLSKNEIPSGNSLFTTSYGLGSACGPLFSAVAMDVFGNQHIFSASLLLFLLFLIHMAMSRKGSNVRVTTREPNL